MKRWGGLKTLERPRVVPEECVLLGGRLDWRGASGEDSRYFIAADTEAVSSLRLVYPFVAWRGPPVLRKGATAWGLRSPKTGSPGRLYVLAEQSRACLNSDAGVGPFPSLFFFWGGHLRISSAPRECAPRGRLSKSAGRPDIRRAPLAWLPARMSRNWKRRNHAGSQQLAAIKQRTASGKQQGADNKEQQSTRDRQEPGKTNKRTRKKQRSYGKRTKNSEMQTSNDGRQQAANSD